MPSFRPYTRRHLGYALQQIRERIYHPIGQLRIQAWRTAEPVPYEQRRNGHELELGVGDKWGDLFDCAWFRFTGVVPPEAAGRRVDLLLDVNGELCVVDQEGSPLRGLTTAASGYDMSLGQPGKRVLPFLEPARGGEEVVG
jgi:alpha-mannosidase